MSEPLARLMAQPVRTVAGLMSGTSLDGVDVAIAELEGSGRTLAIRPLAFEHYPYDERLRDLLLANSAPETSSVRDLSQLHSRLAHVYAAAVEHAVIAAGLATRDIDLIGCHGQTVHHVPDPEDCAGVEIRSTLQIGDPSTLACLLGLPVVGDFRTADMALGGQGAPLVPYFDFVAFSSEHETRGLLNLGGIANLTVLPAGCGVSDVFAFDTGPANMIVDQLMLRFFGEPYDEAGATASSGVVDETLLTYLMSDAYLHRTPPKSTGRERYGHDFVDRLLRNSRAEVLSREDVIATVSAFTAESVAHAYERFIRPQHAIDRLIVAGGGMHNRHIMEGLRQRFAPATVETADAHGVDPDGKEALCFAVLAHEWLNGVPTSIPKVTGATRPALLGKLCLPPPPNT
jgi:anhydro-N-acetylmuramic acid kinase